MKRRIRNMFIVIKDILKRKFLLMFCLFFIITAVVIFICNFNVRFLGNNEKKELKSYIIGNFKEYGFTTMDNKNISPISIKSINDVIIDNALIYDGKRFIVSIVLCNGVFFENCKVQGEICSEDKDLAIKDIEIISDDKIYKEKKTNEDIVRQMVLDEILRGGVFYLENDDRYIQKYIGSNKYSIKDIILKNYIVRSDNTIRAEVQGIIYLDEYKEQYDFDGMVSISGKLSDGNNGNAKLINIYNLPLDLH